MAVIPMKAGDFLCPEGSYVLAHSLGNVELKDIYLAVVAVHPLHLAYRSGNRYDLSAQGAALMLCSIFSWACLVISLPTIGHDWYNRCLSVTWNIMQIKDISFWANEIMETNCSY